MTTSPAGGRSAAIRIAAVTWTALIAVLLTVPGSYVPGEVWSYDKVGHFGMFAGFAYLWLRALGPLSRRRAVLVVVTGLLYAVGSELFQGWMPGERTGDPFDALANAVGLAAGLMAAWLHERLLSRGAVK